MAVGAQVKKNMNLQASGLARIAGSVFRFLCIFNYFLRILLLLWMCSFVKECFYVKYLFFSINVGKVAGRYNRLSLSKTVSRKRKYNVVSDAKVKQLKVVKLKKKTENKMNWGVRAYNDWRNYRLETFNYDVGIYFADLGNLGELTKENFQYAMCRFIPEVTKQKGEGPYPGKTLYQLVVAIQKFLNMNKINWHLIDMKSNEFEDLRNVLDNVMKERTEMGIGTVKRQAQFISYEYEEELWDRDILGEDTPDKLCNTVLYLLGINLALHGVEEHYLLRRQMPNRDSQLSFKRDSNGVRCLVYSEDTCTKNNDGGLAHMRHEHKVVWVYPSANVDRCPVRLVDKYVSLCPPYYKKPNFYLQSKQKLTPIQWYTTKVVGSNTLAKVVKQLLSDAKIDGYFTNHSLRRSAPTRLFQAGVERKLVRELTGHRSDAVDQYQVTSKKQRQYVSEILGSKPTIPDTEECENDIHSDEKKEPERSNAEAKKVSVCSDSKEQVANVIDAIFRNKKHDEKVVIKFEIEISKQ